MSKLYTGTSGYSYKHWWGGVFYPKELPQSKWLEYYAKTFNTVELNAPFYRLPQEKVFLGWYRRTPQYFTFTVKGSRFITHIKRLNDCGEPLALLLSRVGHLKEKLSLILWQLPPSLSFDEERLSKFCELLAGTKQGLEFQNVFEFRDKSWFCDRTYQILKSYNFSICIAHSTRWPCFEVVTASPVYLRFHGGAVLYSSNYSEEELMYWAGKVKVWLSEGMDVYAYFNNDIHGFAVKNAIRLRELIEE